MMGGCQEGTFPFCLPNQNFEPPAQTDSLFSSCLPTTLPRSASSPSFLRCTLAHPHPAPRPALLQALHQKNYPGPRPARPFAGRDPGACALRRRRPPPPLPAAELCQVCEEPARARAGHGESRPPPRTPLSPRAGLRPPPAAGASLAPEAEGMADPLRRTLSRLRGRQGPRAAGGLGLRAAAAATVAASSAAQGDAGVVSEGPPREHAGGAPQSLEPSPPSLQPWGPKTRVPGRRPQQSGALGPRPLGGTEAAPRSRGLTRAPLLAAPGSEGSGEDADGDAAADYYENLPGGSQSALKPQGAEAGRWPPPPPAAGSSPRAEGGRLETGRLQTQLREAYYLLIQAMHDLPPDSGARRGWADRGCPAGAQALGQPPSGCSAAGRPACPRDWEQGGGGRSRQQVSSPWSPPRESWGGQSRTPRMRLSCSRSLESLRVGAKSTPFQRWPSDSWIRCGAREDLDEPPPRVGGMDGWSAGSAGVAEPSGLLSPRSKDPGRIPESTLGDPAGSSVIRSKGDGQEGLPFLKPPAVTVKKLQKWMYKGRLLSLGTKGRAVGTPPKVTGAQGTSPNLASLKMCESQVLSVPPDERITLTGRIVCNKNANTSSLKVN